MSGQSSAMGSIQDCVLERGKTWVSFLKHKIEEEVQTSSDNSLPTLCASKIKLQPNYVIYEWMNKTGTTRNHCDSASYCSDWYPLNIRNVLKWFKRLQNNFNTYLNPYLMVF